MTIRQEKLRAELIDECQRLRTEYGRVPMREYRARGLRIARKWERGLGKTVMRDLADLEKYDLILPADTTHWLAEWIGVSSVCRAFNEPQCPHFHWPNGQTVYLLDQSPDELREYVDALEEFEMEELGEGQEG